MSDALDYLLKARPEAMGAYFAFMKKAGEGLDPKTRALISVLTKVAAQTEPGLKQYLTRALRQGVTANEVLDAMLMAFPMLGLTRIIWAIDIILALDLPEFRLAPGTDQDCWHTVCELGDVKVGTTIRRTCDDRELFIHRTDALSVRVYDSRCPHQVTNIPALAISGDCLTCPKHGWTFDLASGDCIGGGDRPLRSFPVRVDATHVEAFW